MEHHMNQQNISKESLQANQSLNQEYISRKKYQNYIQSNFKPLKFDDSLSNQLQLKKQPTEEKIKKINQRKSRYKRSTNNSHKKFICVARKLLMKQLSVAEKQYFEMEYENFKNSRTYFFIILAHVKITFTRDKIQEYIGAFILAMNAKIQFYKRQIKKTDNKNFINFRFDEISDIQYAISAFELYFKDRVEESIQTIYRKQKITVLKKQQYQLALNKIIEVEEKLKKLDSSSIISSDRVQQLKRRKLVKAKEEDKFDSDSQRDNESFSNQEEGLKRQHKIMNSVDQKIKIQEFSFENNLKPKKQIKEKPLRQGLAINLKQLEHSYPYSESFFNKIYAYSYPQPIDFRNSFANYNPFSYPSNQYFHAFNQKNIPFQSINQFPNFMNKNNSIFDQIGLQNIVKVQINSQITKLKPLPKTAQDEEVDNYQKKQQNSLVK